MFKKGAEKIQSTIYEQQLIDTFEERGIKLNQYQLAIIEECAKLGCSIYQKGDYTLLETLDLMKSSISDFLKLTVKRTYKFSVNSDGTVEGIVLDYKCKNLLKDLEKDLENHYARRIQQLLESGEIIKIEDAEYIENTIGYIGAAIGALLVGCLLVL